MKNCLKVGLFFVALFFTGVGTSAASADKDKTTEATAWVPAWIAKADTVMDTIDISKNECRLKETQFIMDLLEKKLKDTPDKNLSDGDMRYLLEAEGQMLEVLSKKLSCVTHKLDN